MTVFSLLNPPKCPSKHIPKGQDPFFFFISVHIYSGFSSPNEKYILFSLASTDDASAYEERNQFILK